MNRPSSSFPLLKAFLVVLGVFGLGTLLVGMFWFWTSKPSSQAEKATVVAANTKVNLPPDASPELKEFLANRAVLAENFAQMRTARTAGGNASPGKSTELAKTFQDQNQALLKRQAELGRKLAAQKVHAPLPMPPPLKMPPDATPEMQAFLKTRDQLTREQIQLMNQYQAADPAVRKAALKKWQDQNVARFQQLRAEGEAMVKARKS